MSLITGGKCHWLLFLLLTFAVVAAYLPVWHAGFIWDDDAHLTENPCIVGPLGFKEIWTTAAATYYPLVLTTFWLEHAVWGFAPLPYHLVNVLVHSACAILLWVVLARLRVPGAWLGAALWALHPVNVESVAWVTELKNTQSCLFYLLTILLFLHWLEAKRTASYSLALLCAMAAILSKSSTVMLPVVLGLCWWWVERRWVMRNVPALLPFLLISVAASGWTIWEQQFHSGALGTEWAQTWPQRLIIAGRAVWFYLGKLAWPNPLIFIYPRWDVDASKPLAYLPGLAALGGLFFLWWKRNGSARPTFFAAAYFVLSLFPVLGFFKIYFFLYSFVGDHFQYLASIAPLALAGAAINRMPGLRSRAVTAAVLLLFLAGLSWRQSRIYQSDATLWRETLIQNPACWLGHNNLGFEIFRAGAVAEGVAHLQQAISLRPDFPDAHNNLGLALYQAGRTDEAVAHWQTAIKINPRYAIAHNNLAIAFFNAGRVDEAIAEWRTALSLDPNLGDVRRNLEIVLEQRKSLSR